MFSFYKFKPWFQRAFRWIAGDWMTPNQATLLGLVAAAAGGAFLYLGFRVSPLFFLAQPLWLMLRLVCNILDGVLAREKGLADTRGEVLNELSGVVGDGLNYLPIAFFAPGGGTRALAFLVIIAAILAEMTAVLGRLATGTRRDEGPLGGKLDRGIWFGLGVTAAGIFPTALNYAAHYLAVILLFVVLTWLNRLRLILRSL